MPLPPGFIPDAPAAPAAAPSGLPPGFIPDEAAAPQQDYETLGQQALTGVESAGSALTFGLSPWLETKLGLTTPEAIKARKEANPWASRIGTGIGIAAPLLLTAGAAAPLEGAEAASAAAAAAGEAGAGVAAEGGAGLLRSAAELSAPSLISKIGQGAASAADAAGIGTLGRVFAGAATEGALYAGSDVVEKKLLGDPQLTWEKAASEIGLGALLGGGLGVGFHGAAKGLGALLEKSVGGLETIGAKLAKGDPEIINFVMKGESKGTFAELEKASPGIIDNLVQNCTKEQAYFIYKNAPKIIDMESEFPGIADLLTRAAPNTQQRVMDEWAHVIKDPVARHELAASLEDTVNGVHNSVEDALKEVNQHVRPEERAFHLSPEMEGLTGGVGHQEAQAEAARLTVRVSKLVDQMTSEAEKAKFQPSAAAELNDIKNHLATNGTADKSPFELYKLINETKQLIGRQGRYGKNISPEWERSIGEIRSLYSDFRRSLENEEVWGPVAGRQRDFNAAQTAYINARKIIEKGPSFQRLMQQHMLPNGQLEYVANPRSINSWLNLMADPRGGAKTSDFTNYLNASMRLADEMEKSGYANAPQIKSVIQQGMERTKDAQTKGAITQIIKQLQGKEIMSSGPAVSDGSANMLFKAARWLPGGVGHTVGVAHELHGTMTKLSQPSQTVKILDLLRDLAKKSSNKLNDVADGIFKNAATASGGRAATSSSEPERFAHGGIVGPGDFNHVASRIRDYSGDIDKLSGAVAPNTELLQHHAPATADAARAFAARVVGHLASKLPAIPQRQLLDKPAGTPKHAIDKFNRHLDVASRGPLAMLEHLKDGTLHRDHVETSQALFPRLHAEAQQLVAERLGEHVQEGAHIPHRLRGQLGMLLGSAMEHAYQPSTIAANQRMYAQMPAENGPPAPQNGKAREVKTEFSNMAATESERVTSSFRKA